MKRIDVWLVEKGFAPSRTKAQELLDEGMVFLKLEKETDIWKVVTTASFKMNDDFPIENVRVDDQEVLKYVSRGGRKLQSALDAFKIQVTDKLIFDLGQSTGGFTDCVLQRGAKQVIGIDVGSGQLDPKLQKDLRVRYFENVHLKNLSEVLVADLNLNFNLTVCDLSFISSLANLKFILGWSDEVLLLVKPQFELGPEALNKKGLVQKPELISDLRAQFQIEIQGLDYELKSWIPSGLQGKDGNQEYFIYAIRKGTLRR